MRFVERKPTVVTQGTTLLVLLNNWEAYGVGLRVP
jgi:hypothetical protein